ncbi:MAG: hypothetical protein ACTHLE_05995 [Agriterribacter sp.]
MKKSLIAILLSFMLIAGCSKNNDNATTPDCEAKNYGVMKVSFGASDVKHGILVTLAESSTIVRDKIIAAGKVSDTVRLSPGNYHINISSMNSSNQVIEDETFTNRTVTQCQEGNLQVTF